MQRKHFRCHEIEWAAVWDQGVIKLYSRHLYPNNTCCLSECPKTVRAIPGSSNISRFPAVFFAVSCLITFHKLDFAAVKKEIKKEYTKKYKMVQDFLSALQSILTKLFQHPSLNSLPTCWFGICTSLCCIIPRSSSQRLCLSIGAICWDKHVVGRTESEMAATRRSPRGTSSVIPPRIPLCRPWTLTSESTLCNHLQPHTSQNKDRRGLSDAHSCHTARELTVNEHFIQECFM